METARTILIAVWNFVAHTAPGVLLALILGDILTGLLKAGATGQVSSDISRAGMARKVGMLIGVAIAHVLETFSGQPLAAITAICFSISEFISLVENLGALGVKFPPAVTRYFRQLATSAGVDARQLDEPAPRSTAANADGFTETEQAILDRLRDLGVKNHQP